MESEVYEIIILSVCPSESLSPITFESDFYEITVGHALASEGDLYAILFKSNSFIPEWLTWFHNLYQSAWDNEILYDDRPSKEQQFLIK
jgi:hypothetical protein